MTKNEMIGNVQTDRVMTCYTYTKNPADHKGELDMLVTNGPLLVKSIIRDQSKAPCLIFYTDEQMADIRNLCCSGETVIGVDKHLTFVTRMSLQHASNSSLLSVRLPGTP